MNCQLLRGFGPPIMLNSNPKLQIDTSRARGVNQGGMSPSARGNHRSLTTQQSRSSLTPLANNDGGRQTGGPGSEPTYCFCNNVSYGEMIECDNEACLYEWFHFPCVGITE